MGEDGVPDEARGGVGEGVGVLLFHPVGVAAREAGIGALDVVGGESRIRPLMAFGAVDANAVGVVEQDVVAGHLVLVGCELFTKDAQRCVSIALLHVPPWTLVVRARFLAP